METKTDYLRVRLTREEKMRLDLNSTRQGMTISDYAKSGLRYQKVFGKQVEDIQTDWELGDLTAEEQEKLDAVMSDLRSAYLILNELTEKKKVPAWTKNLIRDYILSVLDREQNDKSLLHEILPDEPIRKAKPRADTGKKKGGNKNMSNGRPLDGPWTAEEKMKRIEENRMECNRDEDEEEHNQSSSSSKFL